MKAHGRPRTDGGVVRTFAVAKAPGVKVTRPSDERSARFDPIIDQHAAAQGVSADLVRAVIQVESAFNPRALSPKGAMGLMQLMPATARSLGVLDASIPANNINGGVQYLAGLLKRFKGDISLAAAAYNAGPEAVEKYVGVPPFAETIVYVQRVKLLHQRYKVSM